MFNWFDTLASSLEEKQETNATNGHKRRATGVTLVWLRAIRSAALGRLRGAALLSQFLLSLFFFPFFEGGVARRRRRRQVK